MSVLHGKSPPKYFSEVAGTGEISNFDLVKDLKEVVDYVSIV